MIIKILEKHLKQAFKDSGYDEKYAVVSISNRPDLCQFQSNGCMQAVKEYRKNPMDMCTDVIEAFKKIPQIHDIVLDISGVKPGFININLKDNFIARITNEKYFDENLLIEKTKNPQTIIIDYGGPNVAKPLHVGHLRSAIIGQSIKNLLSYMGHNAIGDIHLGDWGLQMGLIIAMLRQEKPDLKYFEDGYIYDLPDKDEDIINLAPFTMADLNDIYPRASRLAKEDTGFSERAKTDTRLLQEGKDGHKAIWKFIVTLSIKDLRANYSLLGVDFDLWYGESHAHDYIGPMIDYLKSKNAVLESDGALVVEIDDSNDKIDIPPLLLTKNDGSYLYGTTDLATLDMRQKEYQPASILYVVDARQALHFTQVFRVAKKYSIVSPDTKLEFLAFGTMNGTDGKPYKTRDGGVLSLKDLIDSVVLAAKDKIRAKEGIDVEKTSLEVGIGALKFADLYNHRTKDYVFDLDRFTSFEGKTGPYVQYSVVRIKNILAKLNDMGLSDGQVLAAKSQAERSLQLLLDKQESILNLALREYAPNYICDYMYDLASHANAFYHEHHVLGEKNRARQASWQRLLTITLKSLEICMKILGIPITEKM